MFDEEEHKLRLGDSTFFTHRLEKLKPVEQFFLEELKKYPSVASYDCSAQQPFQFWTVNYTSYAGFFMMHPLQDEIKHIQMRDALSHEANDGIDYVKHFSDRVLNNVANKYTHIGSDVGCRDYTKLAVLPGSNLFKAHVSVPKLRWVVEEHGKLAAIKPHPLTQPLNLEELKDMLLPSASILAPTEDMYSIMPYVDTVYASHNSESVLHAVCLDKKIEPLSNYNNRLTCGFSHINEILFSSMEPTSDVFKIFSSYKSGLVNPELQSDWKERIVAYLEYIHKLRLHMRDAYR